MSKPKVFAHRGGTVWAPENTLAAFGKSLAAGVDGIELDVQRCKTGELVVIHRENLSVTTDGTGIVGTTSFDDLRKFSAGSRFSTEFASERVPLLSEVLSLIGGKLTINIEFKNTPNDYPGIEDETMALLRAQNYPLDTIIFSAFDHALLQRLHTKEPGVNIAVLFNGMLLDLPAYASQIGAKYWHPQIHNLRKEHVDAAHAAGLTVNAWTLNTTEEWSLAVALGIDGIMTDNPAGLQAHLTPGTAGSQPADPTK